MGNLKRLNSFFGTLLVQGLTFSLGVGLVFGTAFGTASSAFAGGMFYKTHFTTSAKKPVHNLTDSKLLYYGGPVISNVKVYAVYWGASVDAGLQKNIGGFYKAVSNSTHMDWLTEYNTGINAVDGRKGTAQTIGRGTYGGDYLITPAVTKTDLNDTDIQAELVNQITNKVLPAPDENSLYMIYFPAGVSITIENQTSCSTFCAYHNGFASSKFGSVFYGVIPDLQSGGCNFGCALAGDSFQANTIISSHEFFEAVSDPFPTPGNQPAYPQAWNTSDGQEIGDLCASSSGQLTTASDTFMIQGEWDNASNSCVTGPYQTK